MAIIRVLSPGDPLSAVGELEACEDVGEAALVTSITDTNVAEGLTIVDVDDDVISLVVDDDDDDDEGGRRKSCPISRVNVTTPGSSQQVDDLLFPQQWACPSQRHKKCSPAASPAVERFSTTGLHRRAGYATHSPFPHRNSDMAPPNCYPYNLVG
ncbi:hypothetical protein AB5N19_13042 [Seiridium cardinale]